jgi:polyphosphate kinase 2 (PPK2 family)
MKINSKAFRVRPGEKVKLRDRPTIVKPSCKSKKAYQELLLEHVEGLSALQQLHYASNRYALLLIFQGIDAAGKDGAIRHVMSGINPQGCQVCSFKQPSADELEHDFLWRTTRQLPERGKIGIFNRSYYEEVLVVRVHPEMLRNEGLSEELRDEKTIWGERYRSIVDLESHLFRNGTRTVKIFLHLRRKNSGSDSWSVSMSRTRTGNSASRTCMRGNTGRITGRLLRPACTQLAPSTRRGTWFPPTIRRMPG